MDTKAALATLILGASESIDLISDSEWIVIDHELENVLALADERLRLRGVLAGDNNAGQERLSAYGWDLRTTNVGPSITGLIIDSEYAVFKTTLLDDQRIYSTDDSEVVSAIQQHFDHLWDTSTDLLYEDLLGSSVPEEESRIVQLSNESWNRLIENLLQQPHDLYNLSPRNFEKLVAELLSRQGYEIQLTPKTRDGGRDVIARMESAFGPHLYLVECKRYSRDRPVGVSLIRALYGVVEAERATSGLVVTTSSFSTGALRFRDTVKHRISLADYNDLVQWLRNTKIGA